MEEKPLSENYSYAKQAVIEWFSKLQRERKCNSSNAVSKIVNNTPSDVQESIRWMISEEIVKTVVECTKSRNLIDMLNACNTLNGCFDNFTHAADAVKYSYPIILPFLFCALEECTLECQKSQKTVMIVLELLHSLSRILILILKLIRYDYAKSEKENFYNDKILLSIKTDDNFQENQNEKLQLKVLTQKLQFFMTRDDILIDTKSNFAISSILIREILEPNSENLKEFQKQFLATIPNTIDIRNSKLHHLQFLLSSAIINTWSNNIIDKEATFTYLTFFISLCESYSSETPIILNASRTLLLLVKHKSFYDFLSKSTPEKITSIKDSLLSCIFMLLEHPVACVRNSAKEFLVLLLSHAMIQEHVINSAFKLPRDKRSYFITLASVASELGARILIEKNKDLPKQLLNSIHDPTMVAHVSFTLEKMILKDSLAESNFADWCELWIVPLLISLMSVPTIVGAEIEKLLEKTFKKYPNAMLYITEKWKCPTSEEEIRYVITAMKISHKQGFKFKGLDNSTDGKSKMLISETLLEHCLHQGDDDIRISAFSLLVEARRSTEPYSQKDFQLISYFLKYNLNNHQPSTRQKILSLIRKMLVRFSDSRAAILRQNHLKSNKEVLCSMYDSFLNLVVEFCFCNIFVGSNFNRLNTVLNILLICFECVKDMSFDVRKTDYYWKKLLVALDSSYEENKELAVILSRKLDYSHLVAASPGVIKTLLEKSFCLISHMEPPDVLTGSYLMQILIHLPSSKEALSRYSPDNSEESMGVHYQVIKILMERLKYQVLLAKLDLMTAATCGPMYGTLSAIRHVFKEVDFSNLITEATDSERSSFTKWSKMLNDLVDLCFDIIPTVASVVNSSSPEGHLPMDFQTNFENLNINFIEGDIREKSKMTDLAVAKFVDNFEKIESDINASDFNVYETLRSLKCLFKVGNMLIDKMEDIELYDKIQEVRAVHNKIENLLEKLEKEKKAVDWPATAQVLLLCAWRSVKEASLYLGDFVSKMPIDTALAVGFYSEPTLIRIGEELKVSLCEIKHRGSFEHVYFGFTQFVNFLWKSSLPNLNSLPRQWLEEIAEHLEMPAENQTLKLCSTRRSAGLPFLVQAVICSEIISVKSSTPSSLHAIMKSLLNIIDKGVEKNSDSKIHALNILRALFKHAQLGEHVSSYISKALMVAIRGSRGSTWSERNSSNLLFSSLMIRIFGVSRSKDEISKKNRMTSRTFFQRYSELYEFLLWEMKFAHSTETSKCIYPKPSLYLILLILGRLYPTPREDADILDLSEFLPFINLSCRNPIMKIRELAARALVPLIPHDSLLCELNERFKTLNVENILHQNEIHGILLQIKALLVEFVDTVEKKSEDSTFGQTLHFWVDNTKWILTSVFDANKKVTCTVTSLYLNVLHILFKNFPQSRNNIAEIIFKCHTFDDMLDSLNVKMVSSVTIGIHLCLESFFYLKLDLLAQNSLRIDASSDEKEKLVNLLSSMLTSNVDEIRSIPLRIICSAFRGEEEKLFDEDDFARVGGSPEDLLFYEEKDQIKEMRNLLLMNKKISETLCKPLTGDCRDIFESKINLRLWLRAFCSLLVNGDVSAINENSILRSKLINLMTNFLQSNDKEISSNALLIYSVYSIRQMSKGDGRIQNQELSNLFEGFSSLDADTKDKLAVAKVLNHCFDDLIKKKLFQAMNLWMIPMRLLLDECSTVRLLTSNFVCKLLFYLMKEFQTENLIIPMKILTWPACNLVSLKAQESLLDSYLNVTDEEDRLTLFAHMLNAALTSAHRGKENNELSSDEFGVFEKGNPNPYYEEIAISSLISERLPEWNKVVKMGDYLQVTLNTFLREYLKSNFELPSSSFTNLLEFIRDIGGDDENDKEKSEEFSVIRMQKKVVMKALDLIYNRQ